MPEIQGEVGQRRISSLGVQETDPIEVYRIMRGIDGENVQSFFWVSGAKK